MNARPSHTPPDLRPLHAAVLSALEELASARAAAEQSRTAWEAEQARIDKLTKAISNLVDVLPPQERTQYLRQLEGDVAGIAAMGRSGPVYGNVVSLFQEATRRDWTANEVHKLLSDRGIETDSKTVSNTLAYLAKAGRLRRIARGHYVIVEGAFRGAGIITDAEAPGAEYGQTRTTENDV